MALINASLLQLEIYTPDPLKLGAYYAAAFAMHVEGNPVDVLCTGNDRSLRLLQGPAGQLRGANFRCSDASVLDTLRSSLRTYRVAPVDDSDDSIAVCDPEGRQLRFTLRPQAQPQSNVGNGLSQPPARLQHFAIRTPEPEALLSFYTNGLGFLLSDRVEDEKGRLTAAFLRADEEHHVLAIFRAAAIQFDHFSCETTDWTALRDWADRMATSGHELAWGIGRHGPGNDTFFMVRDPDGNMAEISAELEICQPDRPVGVWPHRPSTLNRWGVAIMRS